MSMIGSICSGLGPLTLSEAKAQFTQWRGTRTKRGKIPDALWDGVKQLAQQHGYYKVAKELGLSLSQMRARLQKEESLVHPMSKGAEFVTATVTPLVACTPPVSHCPTLELSRPDGVTLKAVGLGHQETLALVERFLG